MGRTYISTFAYGFIIPNPEINGWYDVFDVIIDEVNKNYQTKIDYITGAEWPGPVFIKTGGFENWNDRNEFTNELSISFSVSENDVKALEEILSKIKEKFESLSDIDPENRWNNFQCSR